MTKEINGTLSFLKAFLAQGAIVSGRLPCSITGCPTWLPAQLSPRGPSDRYQLVAKTRNPAALVLSAHSDSGWRLPINLQTESARRQYILDRPKRKLRQQRTELLLYHSQIVIVEDSFFEWQFH